MNKFIKNITLLLISVPLLCEVHTAVAFFYPNIKEDELDLWLSEDYHERITIAYYMFELENIAGVAIWFFAFAKVAKLISYKLFYILLVFVGYFITQFLFYIWNRNTSLFSNVMVYIYMSLALILLLFPDKKGGKILNIEDY